MTYIDILKRLRHSHMITLVGTYTYKQSLGLLLHPVAICDMHILFNDVKAYWKSTADVGQFSRRSIKYMQGVSSVSPDRMPGVRRNIFARAKDTPQRSEALKYSDDT